MDIPMTLLAVLIAQREETYSEIVDGFHRCARDHGEDAAITERTLRRWMSGVIQKPRPAQRRVARLYWGFPMSELLAPARAEALISPTTGASGASGASSPHMNSSGWVGPDQGTDWPVWFGMRLAHTTSMIHNWTGEQSDTLQTLLHQEIMMFDASAPDGGPAAFEMSRRQALVTLAALPLTLGAPRGFGNSDAAIEFFLSHCGASLTACWHLLKGSDLDTVDRLLNGYLMELETVARRPSNYQGPAARLASQGHRISGIIALHRNHIRAREHHCKQALEYARIAEDVGSRVSALISLASTYFYDSDPVRAAETYENALTFDAGMSRLQRSRTRAELSVVYGQLGREGETLESAELAEQLYPQQPEQDPSYLYAEFTRASLTLEQGLAYAALAERHPERGYQQIAANVFARVEHAARNSVPDRIRYEITNHQAATAVLLDDMEAFEVYMTRGVEGALLLGSKQRQKEVRAAWRLANETWPADPRLRNLGRDLMPALTAN